MLKHVPDIIGIVWSLPLRSSPSGEGDRHIQGNLYSIFYQQHKKVLRGMRAVKESNSNMEIKEACCSRLTSNG